LSSGFHDVVNAICLGDLLLLKVDRVGDVAEFTSPCLLSLFVRDCNAELIEDSLALLAEDRISRG